MPDETKTLSDLRTIIASEIRSGAHPSLDDVTSAVSAQMDDSLWAGCRTYFLYRYVQDVNRGIRSTRPPRVMGDNAPQPTSDKVTEPAGTLRPVRQFGSVRAARRHTWWQDRLASAVPEMGKPLGQLTVDDVLAYADARMVDANRNLATAAQYRALAAQMREHGAATVADLPEEIACEVFRETA